MKQLELPLHPKLENIFGYSGNANKVLFYLEPEADKLCYVDGFQQGSANTWAYLLWAAHPSVKPFYRSGMLLLDRLERRLYVVSREEAVEALSHPQTAGLQIHNQEANGASPTATWKEANGASPAAAWTEAQQLMADFVVWLGSQGQRKAA
jgi:hypothetical protein